MAHWYMQDNSHGLTINANFMVKNVCYMGLGSYGCFMIEATFMGSHYKTDIISGVGHPRLDLIVPLVLCMVAYNIWGISIVLQVPRDSDNPIRNG